MTSEFSFELLATHELERRTRGAILLRGTTAIDIQYEAGEVSSAPIVVGVRVWDTRSGELIQDFPEHIFLPCFDDVLYYYYGMSVDFSSDASKLAIARWYSTDSRENYCSVEVMDTRTGSVLESESLGHPWHDAFVKFSEDGRFLFYVNRHEPAVGPHAQHNNL